MNTIPERILSFIYRWKIASTKTLQDKAGENRIPYEGLKSSLARLRKNGEIISCRIGPEAFHFHPIYKRRWQALENLPVRARRKHANKWGFDHHLETTNLGFQFESAFPDFFTSTNVFSDYVSFAEGTVDGRGRRFCPDISLSYSKGSLERFIYVEYEKTTKAKRRYLEKWLAYHGESKLRGCLYITHDPNVAHRLEKLIEVYLRTTRQRSDFSFGLITAHSQSKMHPDTNLKELGKGFNRITVLKDFLRQDENRSRTRSNFFGNQEFNDFRDMRERGRLTTLPLPSSTSLKVPDGNVRVVNLPRGEGSQFSRMEEDKIRAGSRGGNTKEEFEKKNNEVSILGLPGNPKSQFQNDKS